MSLARLDAGIVTIVECLSAPQPRGRHRQKGYAESFGRNLKLEEKPISRKTRVLLEFSEPKQVRVSIYSKDKDVRKEGLLEMKRNVTLVVRPVRERRTFIAVQHDWFADFFGRELRKSTSALLQRFEETTANEQSQDVKLIIAFISRKKCRTHHEPEVVDCLITRSIGSRRSMKLYPNVLYIAWKCFNCIENVCLQ